MLIDTASLAMLEQETELSTPKHRRYMCTCTRIHVCIVQHKNIEDIFTHKKFTQIVLQVSNTSESCVEELVCVILLVVCVCRYVSSQVHGMHVCTCIIMCILFVCRCIYGGRVGKKKKTSIPTETDGACCSG